MISDLGSHHYNLCLGRDKDCNEVGRVGRWLFFPAVVAGDGEFIDSVFFLGAVADVVDEEGRA